MWRQGLGRVHASIDQVCAEPGLRPAGWEGASPREICGQGTPPALEIARAGWHPLRRAQCLCWGWGMESASSFFLEKFPNTLQSQYKHVSLPRCKLSLLCCLSEGCCLFKGRDQPITGPPGSPSAAESADFSSSRLQVPLVIQTLEFSPSGFQGQTL